MRGKANASVEVTGLEPMKGKQMTLMKNWVKWGATVLIKGIIELSYVLLGPVVLGCHYCGWMSLGDNLSGAWFITIVISGFCAYDFVGTLLIPWYGGRDNFPLYWENTSPWVGKRKDWEWCVCLDEYRNIKRYRVK